ncbi:MAG: hypothetical protein DMD98_14125 [Candidatus Rokuibacteriota bacterium]|jgi:hypothetical protein|nr:MAG: hypothetical protein AUH14_10870 [Candidatus Rokubacteria bacterium 13_2_20CM_69_15_1]PYN32530.1 MAG: hypothetical protein DMD98_14125 [Candidatus Rokubacteria bacterium]
MNRMKKTQKKADSPGLLDRVLSMIVPNDAASRAEREFYQFGEEHRVILRAFDEHRMQCDACFRREGRARSGLCPTGQKLMDEAESLMGQMERLGGALGFNRDH